MDNSQLTPADGIVGQNITALAGNCMQLAIFAKYNQHRDI